MKYEPLSYDELQELRIRYESAGALPSYDDVMRLLATIDAIEESHTTCMPSCFIDDHTHDHRIL